MAIFNNSWDILLEKELEKEYFKNLKKTLIKEYKEKTIYPKKEDIFKSLKYVDFISCKVLILGQDPYHNENQADGFSFSVPLNIKPPPSLLNILKETESDLKITQPKNRACLLKWAKQGVLLLNAILTVVKNSPRSHSKIGWQKFTDTIISILNKKNKPIVFILWGNFAIKKEKLITNKIHLILKASHPSPLSAYKGFFGCKHFSKTNSFLKKTNQTPINWQL